MTRPSRMAVCFAGIGAAAATISAGILADCTLLYMGLSGASAGWLPRIDWQSGRGTFCALVAAVVVLLLVTADVMRRRDLSETSAAGAAEGASVSLRAGSGAPLHIA